MRGSIITADRIRPGDVVVNGHSAAVERIMGVRGRKPAPGSGVKPLISIVLNTGEVLTVREDAPLRVER